MIFQQVWNRLLRDWKAFLVLGVSPALMWVVMMTVIVIAVVSAIGTDPSADSLSAAASLPVLLLAIAIALPGQAFVGGGLVGSVVAYRRGERASVALFWSYGSQYFARFIGLVFMSGLIGGVVNVVTMVLPSGLDSLVGSVLQCTLIVSLVIYPAYVIASEGASLSEGLAVGMRILRENVREACTGGLMLLAFTWGVLLTVVINIIPLAGQVAWLGILLIAAPFTTYYFAERFETNVRPFVGGSVQEAVELRR